MIDSIILCGGKSTRFNATGGGFSHKFLEDFRGKPILQWVIDKCRTLGGNVILSGGYRFDEVKKKISDVTFLDSGTDTNTGERVRACRDLIRTELFLVTYADGLTDTDLREIAEFKMTTDSYVTVLGIPVIEKFGIITCHDKKVTKFEEKPRRAGEYKSGGYFVCSKEVFKLLDSRINSSWEYDIVPLLAETGKLSVFPCSNFWMCIDTPHELDILRNTATLHGLSSAEIPVTGIQLSENG